MKELKQFSTDFKVRISPNHCIDLGCFAKWKIKLLHAAYSSAVISVGGEEARRLAGAGAARGAGVADNAVERRVGVVHHAAENFARDAQCRAVNAARQ